MHKLKFIIIGLFCLLIATTIAFAVSAEEKGITTVYGQYLSLCQEYILPNSMARPEGFDINAHLKRVKEKRDKAARQLYTSDGLMYVKSRLNSTTDDLEKQCAEQLIAMPAIAFTGESLCGNTHEERVVKGVEPTATELYKKLKTIESGAWKDGFWDETFTYIGEVLTRNGAVYKVGFLSTTWGEACRVTNRLFIFNKNNVCIGQYGGIMEAPVKISGSVLYFPVDPQEGNIIDLENGLPAKAWLNGENHEWMPGQSSSQTPQADNEQDACKAYEKEDIELNSIYNKITTEYAHNIKSIEKFKIAQRAWIKFRDAHVESIFPDDNKSSYGSVYSSCICVYRNELTMTRISELKRLLEGYEEGEACRGTIKIKNK